MLTPLYNNYIEHSLSVTINGFRLSNMLLLLSCSLVLVYSTHMMGAIILYYIILYEVLKFMII